MTDRDETRRFRSELEREFALHLESAERELIEAGSDPRLAHDEARRRFGDADRHRAACCDIHRRRRRARRRGETMSDLLQDLRFAWRTARRGPGFAAAAILTLALGIGANVAVFSVVYGVLLKPLPFPHPERLLMLYETNPDYGWTDAQVATANYLDWNQPNRAFSDIAAYEDGWDAVALTGNHEPVVINAVSVTGNFWSVLGVAPVLGRGFRPEESWRGHSVAVVSHRLWQSRLGGSRAALGTTLRLNGRAFTIVGVAPAGFTYPFRQADLWVPVGWNPADRTEVSFRRAHNLRAVGRLRPGVTLAEARSYLSTMAARLARIYPATNRVMGAGAVPLQRWIAGSRQVPLLLLLGAVLLVLLVACANVANLQLARATVRTSEIALRGALGAGRWRIVRQLFTESVLLALIGGAAGLALGMWGVRGLLAVGPADLPRTDEIGIQGPVLLFACGTTLASMLLFALAPALQASRADAGQTLQRAARGTANRRTRRLREALIAGEVATAALLVIAAALLITSLDRLRHVDLGLRTDHVLTANVSLPHVKYQTTQQVVAFYDELARRLRTLPGVRGAAVTDSLPPTGAGWSGVFAIAGRQEDGRNYQHRLVDAGYFSTLRVPLRRGRLFDSRDGRTRPGAVLINQRLARELFGGEDPIGRSITLDTVGNRPTPTSIWHPIVGVVGDEKLFGPSTPAPLQVYEPLPQNPGSSLQIVVATAGEPLALASPLRAAVQGMDHDLPLNEVTTLADLAAGAVASERFLSLLMALFAVVALALAAVGVASVMAYNVAQRTREIGVRLALGAGGGQVVLQVVRQAMRPAVAGIVTGLVAALAAARVLQGLLFGVRATDPAVFAGVALFLLAVALTASYLPARRARSIDPMLALRQE